MPNRSPRTVPVGIVQARAGADPDENLRRTIGKIEEAAELGAAVVCLQELFRSVYFCQTHDQRNFDLAEPIPGPTTEALAEVAARLRLVLVAPVFERRAAGIYHNSAAVIDADGTIAGVYRKMHIPHDPLFYEKYYFAPGDLGFRAFDTARGRIGVAICWDQWFPEAARLTVLQGAEILFYPTAIGWHPAEKAEFGEAQRDAWTTAMRAHAIANGVFVAAPNRVGLEIGPQGGEGIQFWGSSFIADPFGRVLARAGDEDEEILIADCDAGLIEETRRNWPFLRDRRTDAYGGIAERWLDAPR